jgi:hypothetical protein
VSTLAPLTSSTTGLPTVAPASVHEGSATVKQDYAAAQGFEEMLLAQLSSSLVRSSGLSGEGGEVGGEGEAGGEGGEAGASAAGSGMLTSLLPQALTEGVMHDGGLGLASQLMSSLDPSPPAGSRAVAPTAGASGGSPAGAGAAVSDGSVARDAALTGGASA